MSSARRRARAQRPAASQVPDVFRLEDWVDHHDQPPAEWFHEEPAVPEAEAIFEWRAVQAFRRWQDAKLAQQYQSSGYR
jgi:hypothetical protein